MRGPSTEKIYEEPGLKSLNQGIGTEKLVFCIKFSKMNHLHTFLILYQIVIGNVKQEIQATFPFSLLNIIILRISFLLRCLSGIN